MPARHNQDFSYLKEKLSGYALIHQNIKDKFGWGQQGEYSAALGYKILHLQHEPVGSKILWNFVWDKMGLPKINFFSWLLAHRKVLTGENLAKRGILGPHRCPLCCSEEETIEHLFIECDYACQMWKLILDPLGAQTPQNQKIHQTFVTWQNRYPIPLSRKKGWKKICMAIPKYICWKIWLARNQCIFQDSKPTTAQTTGKAEGLLLEAVLSSALNWELGIEDQERAWLGSLPIQASSKTLRRPEESKRWKIKNEGRRIQKLETSRHYLGFILRWSIKRQPQGGRSGWGADFPWRKIGSNV